MTATVVMTSAAWFKKKNEASEADVGDLHAGEEQLAEKFDLSAEDSLVLLNLFGPSAGICYLQSLRAFFALKALGQGNSRCQIQCTSNVSRMKQADLHLRCRSVHSNLDV